MIAIQIQRKFKLALSVLVIAGVLLAGCSGAPTAQELSGKSAGETASEDTQQLPVTGETQEPDEVATETQAPSETVEPSEEAGLAASEPAPTQTDAPAPPTVAPRPTEPDNGRFSLTTASGVTPEDIIREMTVAVEGKGDGYCFDKGEPVYLSSSERFLMEAVYVSICGWDPNEEITFTVYDPQGEVRSVTEKPVSRNDQIMFRARYQPRLGDPTGNYYFAVVSATTRQEWSVTYNAPSGPHLYIVSENRFRPLISTDTDNYRLFFNEFQPGERVRLFAYEPSGTDSNDNEIRRLVGWQDYKMDANGSLEIESDARNQAFLAYGEQSGEVHLFTLKRGGGDLWDWFGSRDYFCPGAPEPELALNDTANVEFDVNGMDNPGQSGNVSFTLSSGVQVFPQDGPRCADGSYWWLVFDDNGNPGWVPETLDGDQALSKVE